jgi:lipoprotein signal peptidase
MLKLVRVVERIWELSIVLGGNLGAFVDRVLHS